MGPIGSTCLSRHWPLDHRIYTRATQQYVTGILQYARHTDEVHVGSTGSNSQDPVLNTLYDLIDGVKRSPWPRGQFHPVYQKRGAALINAASVPNSEQSPKIVHVSLPARVKQVLSLYIRAFY
jgi:hypothetical protein